MSVERPPSEEKNPLGGEKVTPSPLALIEPEAKPNWFRRQVARVRAWLALEGGSIQIPPFYREHGGNILTAIGALTGTIVATYVSVVPPPPHQRMWFLLAGIASALVLFVGSVVTWRQSSELKKLIEQRRQMQAEISALGQQVDGLRAKNLILRDLLERMVANSLANIYLELNLCNDGRVSLFKRDKDGFRLIGRYAKRPHWGNRSNRLYEGNIGCLGLAWQQGSAYVPLRPDPSRNMEGYCRIAQTKFGLGAEDVRRLKMKSRVYYGSAINDWSGNKWAGVLIIESARYKAFSEDAAQKAFEGWHPTLTEHITLAQDETIGAYENE